MPGTRGLEGLGALVRGVADVGRTVAGGLKKADAAFVERAHAAGNENVGSLDAAIDAIIPQEPEEVAMMAAIPAARAVPPLFRRALVNIGKQAKRANVAGMSQQEALIWTHKIFRAGMRQKTRSGTVIHHAKTGETHEEMARRLRGRFTGKLEPVYIYNKKVLNQKQGEEVGRAMGEVIKHVRPQR